MSVLKYFKNIPRSPSHRATGPMCNFFFFKFATKSLEEKKRGACRPPNGRQDPVARWGGGDRPPTFFLQGLRCKFEEKNYTLGLSPYGRATGVYF